MTDADIAIFILARVAEREAKARAATPGPWRYNPNKVNALDGEESVFAGPPGKAAITVASTGPADDAPSIADADHIALNDPAAVLARCAADRQLVAEHHEVWHTSIRGLSPMNAYLQKGRLGGLYRALQYLALPDADHPDYDKDWTP